MRKSCEITSGKDGRVLPEQDVGDGRSPVREPGQEHHLGPGSRFGHRNVAAGSLGTRAPEPRLCRRSGLGGRRRAGALGQSVPATGQPAGHHFGQHHAKTFPRAPIGTAACLVRQLVRQGAAPGGNPALSRRPPGQAQSSISDRAVSTLRPELALDVRETTLPASESESARLRSDRGGTGAGGGLHHLWPLRLGAEASACRASRVLAAMSPSHPQSKVGSQACPYRVTEEAPPLWRHLTPETAPPPVWRTTSNPAGHRARRRVRYVSGGSTTHERT